ncbi:unnamed protein product, partial [marine sediment metagenome]
ITLAEALRRIGKQIAWPPLEWAMCRGLEGVLFSVGGVDFFPISLGRCPLSDIMQLADDEILGSSVTAAGQPLWNIAFRADVFAPDRRTPSLIKVGEDGPRMYVTGPRPGRLLWRLEEAVPAHVPQQLTEKLRREVVEDLKIEAALALALKRAEQIASAASADGLAAVAEGRKLQTSLTGLFTRRRIISPSRQLMSAMLALGRGGRELMMRVAVTKPVDFTFYDVPGLELKGHDDRSRFMAKAFSLVP